MAKAGGTEQMSKLFFGQIKKAYEFSFKCLLFHINRTFGSYDMAIYFAFM